MIRVDRNAKLTSAKKGRILPLFHDQRHSIVEISAMMQTTEKTVRKWINREALLSIKPTGPPRITTPKQNEEMVQYLRDNPFSTATRAAALQNVPYTMYYCYSAYQRIWNQCSPSRI